MLQVSIFHDQDAENPLEYSGWTLHSFCRRHSNFSHPSDLGLGSLKDGLPVIRDPGLASKFRHGLAYFVSYYEHGQCLWFVAGDYRPGVEFQWDGVSVTGLLVCDDAKDAPKGRDERERVARAVLDEYTSWCNGDVYGYTIDSDDGEFVDSCCGFIGAEHVLDEIRRVVGDQEYEVSGDAAYLMQHA